MSLRFSRPLGLSLVLVTMLAWVAPVLVAPDGNAGQPRAAVRDARVRLHPLEEGDVEPTPGPTPGPTAAPTPAPSPESTPDPDPTASPTDAADPSPGRASATPTATAGSPGPAAPTSSEPPPSAESPAVATPGERGAGTAAGPDADPTAPPGPAVTDDDGHGDGDGHDDDAAVVHDHPDGLGTEGLDGDEVETQSDPVAVDDAMLVGATWTGDARVEVRSGEGEDWSDWVPLVRDTEEHVPDPGSPEAASGVDGVSEPVFVAGAEAVQFRSDDLSRVRATFVDTIGGEGVDWTPESTNSAAAAQAAPRVRTRADWGANESWRTGQVQYSSSGAVRFSVVHHVGGGNWTDGEISRGCARSDDWIRSIYAYHTQTKGWWDIAYNFIVDPCGTIWEGRAGGIDRAVNGAHAGGFNDGSVGVLALGTFSGADPDPVTSRMLDKIETIIAWKLELDQVRPATRTREVSGGGSARTPRGKEAVLPVLSAHQVSNVTGCPGEALMRRLFDGVGATASPKWSYVTGVYDRMTFLPDGFYPDEARVSGSYLPLAGDFTGDGRDDVIWYGKRRRADYLWTARPGQRFTTSRLKVNGAYRPVVGDFDGNGYDDVFWYGPGRRPDRLWWSGPSGFRSRSVTVRGTYVPGVGDFDGNGRDDILWYAAGPARERLWLSTRSGFQVKRDVRQVNGRYVPVVGTYDDRRGDDVVWYARGSAPDHRWLSRGNGRFASQSVNLSGSYVPATGDFDSNGRDDIAWYSPGGADVIWYHQRDGGVTRDRTPVGNLGTAPVGGNFDGTRGADLLFHRPGPTIDPLWWRR